MGTRYHRFVDRPNPISDWGHAMFVKDDPERVRHFGRYHYVFEPDASVPHIADILPALRARIGWDVEEGWSPLSADGGFEEVLRYIGENPEHGLEGVLASYNPDDIVDDAGAWDSGYLLAVAWEVLEGMGASAVLLDDGAIVFDGSLANLVEIDE